MNGVWISIEWNAWLTYLAVEHSQDLSLVVCPAVFWSA
jgi:hypothetical protein